MEKYCDTNLNYYIKIKLTEEGRIIYKKHYAKYNCEAPKLNIDDECYVQFQIHDFMNIFGERLFMGATLPCETNCKIQVKDEWHYVKDGEYPKEKGDYLVAWKRTHHVEEYGKWGFDVDLFNADEGYFEGVGDYVIAWKEIVLPELKENENGRERT